MTYIKNKIVGFTCSCFDLLHAGHILMLKDSKAQCNYLIVGLQKDPAIDRPDTKNKPIQSLKERRIQLDAIKYIDEIIEYKTEKELYNILKKLKPNIRILGSDYLNKPFTGDDLDIKIYYHSREHNYSTTKLRKQINQSNKIIEVVLPRGDKYKYISDSFINTLEIAAFDLNNDFIFFDFKSTISSEYFFAL